MARWQHAVVYGDYVRSFRGVDGAGLGDLPGVLERLDTWPGSPWMRFG